MNIEHSGLIIDVHNLSKTFKDQTAVHNISLKVNYGDIFGFFGPNGAGKTTTIRMLCGLLTPDSGKGTCLGYDLLQQTALIKQHVGYLPQFFGLYKQLTVYENLMLIAELYGVINRKTKVNKMMYRFDLTSKKNQLAGSLSGGWKQRLSIASAIIHEPFLLILDEPTASIDPKTRRDFWDIIFQLHSEGMTILLCSHNMDDIQRCHQIAYINGGRIELAGNINDIIKQIDLTTWEVSGKNLKLLSNQLQHTVGIDAVVSYYDTLHVIGRDKVILNEAIQLYRENLNFNWTLVNATLEEVFILLSNQKKDLN